MFHSYTRFALLALVAGLATACGSRPIPLAAVEGTTAMAAIPRGFDVGYGLVVASNPSTLETPPPFSPTNADEDLQRGELILKLLDPALPPAPGQEVARLPVRMVTRVALHPGSQAARAWSYADFHGAQGIVLFDIPVGLVADGTEKAFLIKIDRYRRIANNLNVYERVPQTYFSSNGGQGIFPPEQLEWFGWGNGNVGSSEAFIPITIVDTPANETQGIQRGTPLLGYGPWEALPWSPSMNEQDVSTTLRATRPSAEVRIEAPYPLDAHAWEMEVTIPVGKVSVQGVRMLRKESEGAIVLYRTESGINCATDGSPRKVFIKVVDPELSTESRAHGVAIMFRHRNSCPQRLVPGDVVIDPASIKAYDLDGQVTQAPGFVVVAQDLL